MSHTIGQAEQNTQESNFNSNLPPQNFQNSISQLESTSGLSDADYEFLFNQLLEGIAHGWHDRRIIKFFNQLGDRGQQADWVAWLQRLREKVLKLPIQSKRQLGTIMIRLGELTQSAIEVKQIGATSGRIGRELLFGDTPAEIWEYVGPDLTPASNYQIETEQEFSERLPDDFAALGAEAVNQGVDPTTESDLWDRDSQDEFDDADSDVAANAVSEEKLDLTIETESPWDTDSQDEFDNADSDVAVDAVSGREEISPQASVDMAGLPQSTQKESYSEANLDLEQDSASSLEGDSENAEILDRVNPPADMQEAQADLATTNKASSDGISIDSEQDTDLDSSASFDDGAIDTVNTTFANSTLENNLDLDSASSSEENLDNELDSAEPVTSYGEEFEFKSSEEPSLETAPTEDGISTSDSNKLADALRVFELEAESKNSDELDAHEQTIELTQNQSQIEPASKRTQNLAWLQQSDFTPNLTTESKLDESSLEVVESWFNLGLKLVSAGEYDRAIASWDKALTINPNLSEAWHNRGSALGRLGDYEEAVKSFQNALKIDPDNYQAWNDRAHALYQLQNWSDAVESWSRAIKIMPGNHLFWYNRGCALEQLGQWSDAIASYEKALEIKPDFQPGRSRYINLIADDSRLN